MDRSGETIDAERQVELLAALGRVEPGPDGHPMMMEVTNQHDLTTAPEGELIFHYDYAYDAHPIEVISMYGAKVEPDATPTLFASSHHVLERIPAPTLECLRALEARHACFLRRWNAPEEPAATAPPAAAPSRRQVLRPGRAAIDQP